MKTSLLLSFLMGLMLPTSAYAQSEEEESAKPKQFLGSSLFMLFNLLPVDDPPSYAQLNYGRWLTEKDVLIVEAITWQYHGPLGVPWGQGGGNPDALFPGTARDIGVGLAYQRYLWKDAYTALHATPFVQQYFDEAGERIQTGFQLFMTLRFGYHFEFWDDRLFFEPSVAFTSWPINTNLPESFAEKEEMWPSYFLFEPGLTVGMFF